MTKSYPNDPQEQFYFLIEQAESYLRRANAVSIKSLRQWRNRALDWLKANVSEVSLCDALLVIPVDQLQRELKVFVQARNIAPMLKQTVNHVRLSSENLKKVFIVHGHDEILKNSVANLLHKLNLEPIILHEQANRGRTLIEKFIEHSEVGFAVVLLTPDDLGGNAKDDIEQFKHRARQNVIMELGYFLGKLGRERVVAIYDQDVEMPSDYSGVLFIPYDDVGLWQYSLAKEMKAVKMPVDLNKLL